MRLKNKVAIITGAARGIGATLAKGLAHEGAKIVIADIKEKEANQIAASIRNSGGEALASFTDVCNSSSVETMVINTINEFDTIDILINNAALFADIPHRSCEDIPEEEWDSVMAVNLKGAFLCVRAVLPHMKKQKKGKIINIHSSSVYDGGVYEGSKGRTSYVSSKAGIVGFTRALAKEVGNYGINVNALTPGSTVTEITKHLYSEELLQQKAAGRCIKRLQTPEDLIGPAIFLASSDSDFITGHSIVVDGGRTMP